MSSALAPEPRGLDIIEHGAPAFHPEYAYMGYSPIPGGKTASAPVSKGAPSISVSGLLSVASGL